MNAQLNQKIFDGMSMKFDVRETILSIVGVFIDTVCKNSEICLTPLDVVLVGSNAAYNYSETSDLDVHIILNYDMIDGDPNELIQSYFNAEKTNFNDKYNFTVKGIDVELYVEDVNTSSVTSGIYSVLNDEWVKKPTPTSINFFVDQFKLDDLIFEINEVFSGESAGAIEDMINKLYLMRKYSLSIDGESGQGNLLFKEIRGLGLLDQLKDRLYELKSKYLSLESKGVVIND